MPHLNPELESVTARIRERSLRSREAYLQKISRLASRETRRAALSCSNLAHGFAACGTDDKAALSGDEKPNLGIVTAFNDMLSAHQPFEDFPPLIKQAARDAGAVAQVAGGVPAMCDGVTQGQDGMELSLFSRDVIAMSTAVGLSHDMFDGALCLGVCDKIVPGLLIGALSFGHLPVVFLPAGPMPSGLSNKEKARIRQEYAAGKIGRDELLAAESAAYHSPGTCTFYGTANSNQMFMEIMGLHLPGSSFVPPGTPLRRAFTVAATRRLVDLTASGSEPTPLAEVVDERTIVNAIVGLLATGGSTNHTIHLVAIARAAGVLIDWQDFDDLSRVVPLLTRVYPNGTADVNHFHTAGGLAYLIRELLGAGLLHGDVRTVAGGGLAPYCREARLEGDELVWEPVPTEPRDRDILRPAGEPFQSTGGLRLLSGNLGRAVVKISAVKPRHQALEAPAVVFDSQAALTQAFEAGELDRDFVAVVRFQGPRANGMPELHKLMPPLGVLQDRGFRVALVTDGRLSGASGKVLSAIHVTPEALTGGALARLRDGDLLRVDAEAGVLEAVVPQEDWERREPAEPSTDSDEGLGRELFAGFRQQSTSAEEGAMSFGSFSGPAAGSSEESTEVVPVRSW